MKISRDHVVDTALQLLNEVGLDRLSTRMLAERLGVQQPALYWHFKNKQELIGALNVEMLRRGHGRQVPAPGEPWRDFLLANAGSFRNALLAFRDGARIHAGSADGGPDPAVLNAQVAILVDAGFAPALAIELLAAIGRYVVGCVLEEQAGPAAVPAPGEDGVTRYPVLAQALAHCAAAPPSRFFASGLAMLIDGAAAQLRHAAAG